jgi:hypothetical protein
VKQGVRWKGHSQRFGNSTEGGNCHHCSDHASFLPETGYESYHLARIFLPPVINVLAWEISQDQDKPLTRFAQVLDMLSSSTHEEFLD